MILVAYLCVFCASAQAKEAMEQVAKDYLGKAVEDVDKRPTNLWFSKEDREKLRTTNVKIKDIKTGQRLNEKVKVHRLKGPGVGGGGFAYYYTALPNLIKIQANIELRMKKYNENQLAGILGSDFNWPQFFEALAGIDVNFSPELQEIKVDYLEIDGAILLTPYFLNKINWENLPPATLMNAYKVIIKISIMKMGLSLSEELLHFLANLILHEEVLNIYDIPILEYRDTSLEFNPKVGYTFYGTTEIGFKKIMQFLDLIDANTFQKLFVTPQYPNLTIKEYKKYYLHVGYRSPEIHSFMYRKNPKGQLEPLVFNYILPGDSDQWRREETSRGVIYPTASYMLKYNKPKLSEQEAYELTRDLIHEISHLLGVGRESDEDSRAYANRIMTHMREVGIWKNLKN